jgi:hypothetical protein
MDPKFNQNQPSNEPNLESENRSEKNLKTIAGILFIGSLIIGGVIAYNPNQNNEQDDNYKMPNQPQISSVLETRQNSQKLSDLKNISSSSIASSSIKSSSESSSSSSILSERNQKSNVGPDVADIFAKNPAEAQIIKDKTDKLIDGAKSLNSVAVPKATQIIEDTKTKIIDAVEQKALKNKEFRCYRGLPVITNLNAQKQKICNPITGAELETINIRSGLEKCLLYKKDGKTGKVVEVKENCETPPGIYVIDRTERNFVMNGSGYVNNCYYGNLAHYLKNIKTGVSEGYALHDITSVSSRNPDTNKCLDDKKPMVYNLDFGNPANYLAYGSHGCVNLPEITDGVANLKVDDKVFIYNSDSEWPADGFAKK